MKRVMSLILCNFMILDAHATSIALGAAPKGDAIKIAEKIIKFNFPKCKRVTTATRLADGTIKSKCDGIDYQVFTLYSADEGRMLELALDCKEAKLLGVSCSN